nr:MAG TPA: hypothetical protein [Caudoviricetes sp.]
MYTRKSLTSRPFAIPFITRFLRCYRIILSYTPNSDKLGFT